MATLLVPSIFKYEQLTPSAVWNITHSLGHNGGIGLPIVDTFIQDNGYDEKIIPVEVIKVDEDNVQITFSAPRAGFAVIIV